MGFPEASEGLLLTFFAKTACENDLEHGAKNSPAEKYLSSLCKIPATNTVLTSSSYMPAVLA